VERFSRPLDAEVLASVSPENPLSSTFTSLNGINRRGFICGRYLDAAGIEHGILARVKPGRADRAAHEMRANSLPVSPGQTCRASSFGAANFRARVIANFVTKLLLDSTSPIR